MQCELLGAVAVALVSQVTDLLIGLSGGAGAPVHYRDLLVRSQTSPFTELHLVQHLSGTPSTGSLFMPIPESCKLCRAMQLGS